jgi:ribosomal protein L29
MSELASKSDKELHKELREKREAVRENRFAVTGTQETKPHEVKKMRKDIARILTELNKRSHT